MTWHTPRKASPPGASSLPIGISNEGVAVTASFLRRAVLAGVAVVLVAAGSAGAVIGLPSDGSQVNNDPAAGIDPNQNAGISDVVGG